MFGFRTRPQDEEHWQPKLAIYGDLGIINGVSIDLYVILNFFYFKTNNNLHFH